MPGRNYGIQSEWVSLRGTEEQHAQFFNLLEKGDRLELKYNKLDAYHHFVLYMGDLNLEPMVLELDKKDGQSWLSAQMKKFSLSLEGEFRFSLCWTGGTIRTVFLSKILLENKDYYHSIRINNYPDRDNDPKEPDEIGKNAFKLLKENDGFYNAVLFNCETLTNLARYGVQFSKMATDYRKSMEEFKIPCIIGGVVVGAGAGAVACGSLGAAKTTAVLLGVSVGQGAFFFFYLGAACIVVYKKMKENDNIEPVKVAEIAIPDQEIPLHASNIIKDLSRYPVA